MKKLAPIILFTYNRPIHTERTLNALAANKEAKESILYIYCDGPKDHCTEEQLENINKVRQIVREESRFKKVIVCVQEKNKGLAISIIDGVTEIVNKYEMVIVLEDDIVTSEGFLKYMNDALEVYKNVEQVMHISGYTLPINEKLPSTFLYKPTLCWGWATWARAWKFFEKNPSKQIEAITSRKAWKEFTIDFSSPDFKHQLERNLMGDINTWSIFWYASVFLNGGTSLHPYPSLVQNIGIDGTGVHSGGDDISNSPFNWKYLASEIVVESIDNFDDRRAYLKMKRFYNKLYAPSIFYRFKQILELILSSLNLKLKH